MPKSPVGLSKETKRLLKKGYKANQKEIEDLGKKKRKKQFKPGIQFLQYCGGGNTFIKVKATWKDFEKVNCNRERLLSEVLDWKVYDTDLGNYRVYISPDFQGNIIKRDGKDFWRDGEDGKWLSKPIKRKISAKKKIAKKN